MTDDTPIIMKIGDDLVEIGTGYKHLNDTDRMFQITDCDTKASKRRFTISRNTIIRTVAVVLMLAIVVIAFVSVILLSNLSINRTYLAIVSVFIGVMMLCLMILIDVLSETFS